VYKYINGVLTPLTPEEIATREAEELAESLRDKRPVANGKHLVSAIEKAFIGQPFLVRMQLQAIFAPIKNTLESQTCINLASNDFNAVLTLVATNSNLDDSQKQLFTALANDWKETVQFNN
jgi:hypothetical protein